MDNKILVIYFSKTDNTKVISENIAKKLKSDIYEIREPAKKQGFFSRLFDKSKKNNVELDIPIPEKNINDYDTIIIGTPVWYWTIPEIVKEYLTNNNISNKNVAFFCTHNGNMINAISDLDKILNKNHILAKLDLQLILKSSPIDNMTISLEKINIFCENIKKKTATEKF